MLLTVDFIAYGNSISYEAINEEGALYAEPSFTFSKQEGSYESALLQGKEWLTNFLLVAELEGHTVALDESVSS